MKIQIGNTRISLVMGDITEQETDAIVNAANSSLMGGGGVDGAIHRKGGPDILNECKILRRSLPEGLPTGEAVITGGGRMKAKKVIHTVGPIWRGGFQKEADLLARAYENSMALAMENGIKTISFPSISTGAYGYPINEACRIAMSTVIGFIRKNDWFLEIRFVLHSEHDLRLYEECSRVLI